MRHPSVHPRGLYSDVRRHVERIHRIPFDDYVFGCGTRNYTEFPVLGAYALKVHPERYHWIDARSPHEDFDLEKAPGVREKMRQFPGRSFHPLVRSVRLQRVRNVDVVQAFMVDLDKCVPSE